MKIKGELLVIIPLMVLNLVIRKIIDLL